MTGRCKFTGDGDTHFAAECTRDGRYLVLITDSDGETHPYRRCGEHAARMVADNAVAIATRQITLTVEDA